MTRVIDCRVDPVPEEHYIGRGYGGQVPSMPGEYGWLGNPFRESGAIMRAHAIRMFRHYFFARLDLDSHFFYRVRKLKDAKLGCFCKPKPCHGDVIVEYLDNNRLFW